jgi:hypothetical protein
MEQLRYHAKPPNCLEKITLNLVNISVRELVSTDGKDHSAKTKVEIDRLSLIKDCFILKLTSSGPFKKIIDSLIPKHVWMGMDLWHQT